MEEEASRNFKDLLRQLESQHLVELKSLRQEAERRFWPANAIGQGTIEDANSPVPREDLPIRSYPVFGFSVTSTFGLSQITEASGSECDDPPVGPVAEEVDEEHSTVAMMDTITTDVPRSRQKVQLHRFSSTISMLDRAVFETDTYELFMGSMVLLSVVVLALEMQFLGYQIGFSMDYPSITLPAETWGSALVALRWTDRTFTGIFVLDILLRFAFLRCRFFSQWLNILDFVVISCSVLEELLGGAFPVDAPFLRLLRFAKVARSLRVLKRTHILGSLHLLLKSVHASLEVLFWSLCLLGVIQCIAGMLLAQSLQGFLSQETNDVAVRQAIFRYFGTFSATLLTMFEVLMANWAPPCRILVDNVSEWYAFGFIIYRCLVGFAVLNVVSAVFLQQTMKVAAADQEVALQQRQMATEAYTNKLEAFFKRLDKSGDGVLTWKEFSAVLHSPKLQNWLATLELESNDLVNLFNMIDDGDGEISLDQFLHGARHLHGSATNVAVAEVMATARRTEAKMEAVLAMIAHSSGVGVQDLKKQARRRTSPTASSPRQLPEKSRL